MNTVRHLGALLGGSRRARRKEPPQSEHLERLSEVFAQSSSTSADSSKVTITPTSSPEIFTSFHGLGSRRVSLRRQETSPVERWLDDISARSSDGLAHRLAWPDLDRDRRRSKHRTELQRASFGESDGGRSSAAVPQELGDSPIVNAIWVSRPSKSSALTHELECGAPLTFTACT
jgi:hypothetical protein